MTANQIRAAELFEKKRSNLRNEDIGFGTLNESVRHNLANEQLQTNTLKETARHNRQQESISWGNLGELSRHNLAYEQETQRHNKAAEVHNYFDTVLSTVGRIAGPLLGRVL